MEEIKLVLEALQTLGEGAKTAFIIWMLIKYLAYYTLTAGCFLAFFALTYKLLKPLVIAQTFITNIKSAMGFSGGLVNSEKNQVLEVLEKWKNRKV